MTWFEKTLLVAYYNEFELLIKTWYYKSVHHGALLKREPFFQGVMRCLSQEREQQEKEETERIAEENLKRVEEAQRKEAMERQRKEEERYRELEELQRQKEEAMRRKKAEEEEERLKQMKLLGKNKSRPKLSFALSSK